MARITQSATPMAARSRRKDGFASFAYARAHAQPSTISRSRRHVASPTRELQLVQRACRNARYYTHFHANTRPSPQAAHMVPPPSAGLSSSLRLRYRSNAYLNTYLEGRSYPGLARAHRRSSNGRSRISVRNEACKKK